MQKYLSEHKEANCKVCLSRLMLGDIRPIFISGEQHNCEFRSSRPKGVNNIPVHNPSSLTSLGQNNQALTNNIEADRQVAGMSTLSSNFMLVFVKLINMQSNLGNEDDDVQVPIQESQLMLAGIQQSKSMLYKKVDQCASRLQKCLIISIMLVVGGILFMGTKI